MAGLGTIVTAMITPFDERGALDAPEAQRLATWLADRGNDGLVIAGSTGEGMTLDAGERAELIAAVKDAVSGRAAVIANVGTSDTRSTIAAAREAQAAGADALLVVVPPYNKPPQSGMLAHFGAVADAVALPLIVYNIPGRTAANMLPETLLELARRHRNVAGVKESSGDLNQIAT
ncbi:MAG TPA: dihydrodipicolinate synthase family protein, partial [Candidatus Baltobacteraceae bacterium]|nr:dihydrodipicolinate synthase family protein [Candidatus Baltobacteraceae bacterium]